MRIIVKHGAVTERDLKKSTTQGVDCGRESPKIIWMLQKIHVSTTISVLSKLVVACYPMFDLIPIYFQLRTTFYTFLIKKYTTFQNFQLI